MITHRPSTGSTYLGSLAAVALRAHRLLPLTGARNGDVPPPNRLSLFHGLDRWGYSSAQQRKQQRPQQLKLHSPQASSPSTRLGDRGQAPHDPPSGRPCQVSNCFQLGSWPIRLTALGVREVGGRASPPHPPCSHISFLRKLIHEIQTGVIESPRLFVWRNTENTEIFQLSHLAQPLTHTFQMTRLK